MEQQLTSRQTFWRDHILAAQRDQLTYTEYAKQHGLSLSAFYNWSMTLRRKGLLRQTEPAFVELKVDRVSSDKCGGCYLKWWQPDTVEPHPDRWGRVGRASGMRVEERSFSCKSGFIAGIRFIVTEQGCANRSLVPRDSSLTNLQRRAVGLAMDRWQVKPSKGNKPSGDTQKSLQNRYTKL